MFHLPRELNVLRTQDFFCFWLRLEKKKKKKSYSIKLVWSCLGTGADAGHMFLRSVGIHYVSLWMWNNEPLKSFKHIVHSAVCKSVQSQRCRDSPQRIHIYKNDTHGNRKQYFASARAVWRDGRSSIFTHRRSAARLFTAASSDRIKASFFVDTCEINHALLCWRISVTFSVGSEASRLLSIFPAASVVVLTSWSYFCFPHVMFTPTSHWHGV